MDIELILHVITLLSLISKEFHEKEINWCSFKCKLCSIQIERNNKHN